MEPLSCPECKVPLTSEEAERGRCPCCKVALPAWVVREGERRQFRSSVPRSARSPDVPEDRLPTLARVARWTIRISGAGMIFVGAGCFGVSMLAAFIPANLPAGQKGEMISLFMTGCAGLFILLFVTLLVGVGLKVLAGDTQ
jgi:hypothetical protein